MLLLFKHGTFPKRGGNKEAAGELFSDLSAKEKETETFESPRFSVPTSQVENREAGLRGPKAERGVTLEMGNQNVALTCSDRAKEHRAR
ncbi:hypothetical protein GMST_29880 [Geomonas silvestris]|uniref:Uncharacterized protein n=1 Tax=Geomonas silvestris TaxID=2740184 RepID=A0A6V8MLP5_9BACT|nr:hypothetical protein GMST_29880 [Geomonas silvestris]